MLPGLLAFLLIGLAAPGPAAAAEAPAPAVGADRLLAAVMQAPGDETPPEEGEEEDVEEEADTTTVSFPDTTGLKPLAAPADTTLRAPADTLGSGAPTRSIRQPGAAATDSLGRPLPGPSGGPGGVQGTGPTRAPTGTGAAAVPKEPAERRGLLGVHPAVLILGLIVAHVFVVKLVTD